MNASCTHDRQTRTDSLIIIIIIYKRVDELRGLAADRQKWRELVIDVCDLDAARCKVLLALLLLALCVVRGHDLTYV